MILLILACKGKDEASPKPADPPLGMVLEQDGQIYAGAAAIDITPEVVETFTDVNGNAYFEGCFDDPAAADDGCDEPFDDVNGNGWFDAVWIGGFGPLRAAAGVHDTVEVRAVVLSFDGEYIALVGIDSVGIASPRIHAARDALAADGFDDTRLLVGASHNHQGPDMMGLWGDALAGISGKDDVYMETVELAIEDVVRDAAASMVAVDLTIGAKNMRDVQGSEWLAGSHWGGKNPADIFYGMIYDRRDPIVISDQLLVMQGNTTDGDTVFTYTNWSGHPEVWGGDNQLISADWVGVTQDVLDERYGGITVHMPEALGGMQSALGGKMPLVDEDGTRIWVDAAESEPVWAEDDTWDYVRSHGWIIADAATEILDEADVYTSAPIKVDRETLYLPVENTTYQLLAPSDIFDLNLSDGVFDADLCPEAATSPLGCVATNTFRARVGPIGFVSAPGELLPELARGFPDDKDWRTEESDPTKRGPGAKYFPQHDPDCNGLSSFAECELDFEVGDCNCLSIHAWPYELAPDEDEPLLAVWDDTDVAFTAILGMTDNNLSYIIPEPDFHHGVSLLTDDGDHYEDTVSPGSLFATKLLEAQQRIDERW